jgi:hypothetical protein
MRKKVTEKETAIPGVKKKAAEVYQDILSYTEGATHYSPEKLLSIIHEGEITKVSYHEDYSCTVFDIISSPGLQIRLPELR